MPVVFFYGLFMDERLLKQQGLSPSNSRFARLRGYRLWIGQRANLVEDARATACGLVFDLPAGDVLKLYSNPSVCDYQPVSVCPQLKDDIEQPAICYLLPTRSSQKGRNADYAKKLYLLARELDFPDDYLAEIQLATDSIARLDEG